LSFRVSEDPRGQRVKKVNQGSRDLQVQEELWVPKAPRAVLVLRVSQELQESPAWWAPRENLVKTERTGGQETQVPRVRLGPRGKWDLLDRRAKWFVH
jgi:hypothetical protein